MASPTVHVRIRIDREVWEEFTKHIQYGRARMVNHLLENYNAHARAFAPATGEPDANATNR